MARDFDDDIRADADNDANNNTDSDYGGDIAGDDGVDLNDAASIAEAEPYSDVSARDAITAAAMSHAGNPGPWAQIAGTFGPPGSEDAISNGVEMVINGGIAGAAALMEAAYRQYGNPEMRTLEIQHQLTPKEANLPDDEHKEDT
jgi:hypothetical protein